MANEKKRRRGRPPSEGPDKITLQVRVHPDFAAAVTALAQKNRRPRPTEMLIALENHLKAHNALPDSYATGNDDGD